MNAELSRRAGRILGMHPVTPEERRRVIAAVEAADTWNDLSPDIQQLLTEIESRSDPGETS